ncbi:20246_t:CDS:2, partial [Gigaspora margarita]
WLDINYKKPLENQDKETIKLQASQFLCGITTKNGGRYSRTSLKNTLSAINWHLQNVKPDKHKKEAIAKILNKLINTTPSNKMVQDLSINTILSNEIAQDSIEQINSESNNNKESQSIRSEDDELSNVDLNNSVQV